MTVHYFPQSQQEANNLLQTSEITLGFLNKTEYLAWVLKEDLRISPLIGDVATKDHRLGQIKIKNDTLVYKLDSNTSYL